MVKKFFGLLLLVALAAGAFFVKNRYVPPQPEELAAEPVVDSATVVEEPKEPRMLYGMILEEDHVVIEETIRRNQFLGEILAEYHVPAKLIHELSQVSRKVFDPRKIRPNARYTIIANQDSITKARAFVYEPNPIEYIIFRFEDSLSVDVGRREIETVEREISGVVYSSLSATMESLGMPAELTNRFVDVFGWQVDFERLQRGDRFKLVYEERLVEGKSIGIGAINAIYFEHFGQPYYAFPYDQGEGIDYFDEDGKSLRKALLKYPIQFTRISSRYTKARFHPVQKRWKPHLGTDFAAPTGTPIRTVGDGIVLEARYTRNNGNYVKIRHNATYTTQYLHMSRIASGVRPGVKVKQEQVIGYVGSTGLATGPHLCYRFWKNGVQVDALRVELPPSQPILDEHKEAFEVQKNLWTTRLDAIPFPVEEGETFASAR